MSNSFGGVASRGPVKGAYGIGKIHLKFKPRVNRLYSIKALLALFTYILFIFMIIFSYSWSQKNIKYKYLFPFVQNVYILFDTMKSNINYYMYFKTALSHKTSGINIDSNGIPTITASNLSYALYLQGYQHAKDRILSMDIFRKKSLGTLSTLYGNTTISIESDKLMRTLNIANIAKADVSLLDHDDKILLESYSNGINQYLQEKQYYTIEYNILYSSNLFNYFWSWYTNNNSLSLSCSSIDAWETYHTLAILRMLAYEWSHSWEDEISQWILLKSFDDMSLHDFWYDKNHWNINTNNHNANANDSNINEQDQNSFLPSLSSIAIAISKNNTNDNHAYLANNLNSKSISSKLWYFNSLHTHDSQVSGVSIPGIPYVFIGRNHHISWGMTISTLYDTEDLFILHETSNSNSSDILSDSNHHIESNSNTSIRTEYISIKDQQEPYILSVTDTLYGPIISNLFVDAITSYTLPKVSSMKSLAEADNNNKSNNIIADDSNNKLTFALSSQALRQPMNLKFLHDLNHANNFNEFQSALNNLHVMHLNVLYSDINGNIGSVVTGSLPIRPVNNSGELPTEGIASNAWIMHANATTTNNNTTTTTTTSMDSFILRNKRSMYNPMEGVIIATDYPYKILNSILDVKKELISFEQLQSLLLDTYSHSSLLIKQILLNITTSSILSNDINNNLPQEHYDILVNTKKLMSGFEGYYHKNESAPVLIEAFRNILVSNLLSSSRSISTVISQNSPFVVSNRFNKYPIRLEIDWIQNFLLSSGNIYSKKWIQNIKKHRPIDDNNSYLDYYNRFLFYSLLDAYQWCALHYGSNAEHWSWGNTHHIYMKSTHTNLSPIMEAALTIGPYYNMSAGGLDSLLRSEYSSNTITGGGGDLKRDYDGHGLMASIDSVSTSLRLAFNMGDVESYCFSGNAPPYPLSNNNKGMQHAYKKLTSFW